MSKFKIDNIFPSVDERGNDIITFEVNERKVYEKIDDRNDLAKDEKSALVNEFKFSEADARAINEGLQIWVDANTDTRFARNSSHPYVETVEYGLHASKDEIAVFLTAEGNARLSLDNGYSLQGSRVLYDSPEFGAQVYDNSPVDEPFSAVVKAYYDTPESHIETIALKHEEMREEAKELNSDKPAYYELTWDSTDMVGIYGSDGLGTMPAGEYTSKEEALAAIDGARQEMIDAGSGDQDEIDYINKGTFSITYTGPSEIVENIRVDELNGQLFARFDIKTIDIKGDEKVYSTGDWIDLKDGLLTDTDSNIYLNNSDTEFDRDEVTATVNRHLKANPISERTLDKYRAAAESEKEDEEKDRLVAS
ncbi:hypothetical protein [Brucella gallinifaecis]|uniref:hypothetical protein n=1 Tax=Brucella gallinifaecis TaxID=215590 RepID=UPI00235DE8EE|nr:hypothetical protein [Brucella gallinifaecis]